MPAHAGVGVGRYTSSLTVKVKSSYTAFYWRRRKKDISERHFALV